MGGHLYLLWFTFKAAPMWKEESLGRVNKTPSQMSENPDTGAIYLPGPTRITEQLNITANSAPQPLSLPPSQVCYALRGS